MVKRDGAETRRQRITLIAKMAHSAIHTSQNGEISLEKFVASVMYETGLTQEKIMEYLRVSEKMGQFEIDDVNDVIRKPRM
jgi:hypothetical protein